MWLLVTIAVLIALRVVGMTWYRKRLSMDKPYGVCFLDSVLEFLWYFKVGPFSKSNDILYALVTAMQSTGLTDLGASEQIDMVQKYSIVREVGLKKSQIRYSPLGYVVVQSILTRRMESRLQLVDYLKRHPVVETVKIKDPVFVIGFPRTGTTFLHELLDLHENGRSHFSWEQFDPVPSTDSENIDDLMADRQRKYQRNLPEFNFKLYFAGNEIQHVHRIGYDETEECTTPLAIELPWSVSELALNIFAADELFPLGAGTAFQHYRKFLQLLTFQAADKRDKDFTWILKCPFHLPYLEELHQEFPNATIVWTHRDPADCVASACSLYETLIRSGVEGDSINRKLFGEAVMNHTRKSLDRAEAVIKELGTRFKIMHIRYEDNVKDPKSICSEIFAKVKHP